MGQQHFNLPLVWEYVAKLSEVDLDNHENGCGVDELRAHIFLEKFDEVIYRFVALSV